MTDTIASILIRLEWEGVITTRQALDQRLTWIVESLGGALTRREVELAITGDACHWEDLVEWLKSQTGGTP